MRRWLSLGRRRKYGWEARLRDGTVERDVEIDRVLQCGRYPRRWLGNTARRRAACGTEARGPWVEYPTGYPLLDVGRERH